MRSRYHNTSPAKLLLSITYKFDMLRRSDIITEQTFSLNEYLTSPIFADATFCVVSD